MRSSEDLLQNYDDRRLILSDVSKKNLSTNLLDSSYHRVSVGKGSSTHDRRRNSVEDADAGISYYSHSGISLPAYNNTYCDKQDLWVTVVGTHPTHAHAGRTAIMLT